jgi:hypothetical protein
MEYFRDLAADDRCISGSRHVVRCWRESLNARSSGLMPAPKAPGIVRQSGAGQPISLPAPLLQEKIKPLEDAGLQDQVADYVAPLLPPKTVAPPAPDAPAQAPAAKADAADVAKATPGLKQRLTLRRCS